MKWFLGDGDGVDERGVGKAAISLDCVSTNERRSGAMRTENRIDIEVLGNASLLLSHTESMHIRGGCVLATSSLVKVGPWRGITSLERWVSRKHVNGVLLT